MESAERSSLGSEPSIDVEVLVVGAGVLGIYQLYRCREVGLSVAMLEAGRGVGGTWFWNRYPGARFDSESYTYGYFFSEELYRDWAWQEHFSGQPEIERYLNHVVDRFDLRGLIQFGKRVVSADWYEAAGTWTVRTQDGTEVVCRHLIAATGVLSIPVFPDIPGLDSFTGTAHHTGLWPADPIDFRDKRVAVVGTGSSGVQVVPEVLDDAASITVFQRTPNWCAPLNNRPITPEEQAQLWADFEHIRDTVNTTPSGFLHQRNLRSAYEDTPEVRRDFYEKMWNSQGFAKLSSHYKDMKTDPVINREWCAFIADKIRGIVRDPDIADELIPKDHLYGDKRPPFVTDYFEAFNSPKVELVNIVKNPIVRVTESGIETTDGLREFDIIVWATGFDFGSGALMRMGVIGRNGLKLTDYWSNGPRTFMGIQCVGFPNFFFPGGPHGAGANNPRYGADQIDFIIDVLNYMRDRDYEIVEVEQFAEDEWTDMVDTIAETSAAHGDISYFFGANIAGKARRYLINPGGRPKLFEVIAKSKEDEYKVYALSRSAIRVG
jgi:cation diffusion facilitator CzcD-associated flavoprotein CzcO